MMYHALYRKYRPIDFDSVVGQNSIVRTLKNSVIRGTFSHAYMFFGPRGTGKTTVSKILARNINCLNTSDGTACGKCDACKVSFSKDCVDIIEIDAASNNGVDEIRELKNKISLVPSVLKFKVYIIDEVHMLSIGAFNALLKTLEDPPEHAIFILATTDPQKVPDTIVSRCQCYSFKRISDNIIFDRLKFICNEEKISIDDSVLKRIAILSDGGLRDALGSLDKLVSYSSDKISMEDFNEVNGVVSDDDLSNLLSSIVLCDTKKVLEFISNFSDCGKNLIQIIVLFIDYLRNIIVDYYVSNSETDFSIDILIDLLNILNEKLFEIKKSGNTRAYIEVVLLKFINSLNSSNKEKNIINESKNSKSNITKNGIVDKGELKKINDINNDYKKLSAEHEIVEDGFEQDNNSIDDSSDNQLTRNILNIDDINEVRINNAFATASKNLLKLEINNFDMLNDYTFDQNIGYIVCSILDSKLRVVGSNYMIISFESDAIVKQNLFNMFKFDEVYNTITNSNKKFAIISDTMWEKLKDDYINKIKSDYKFEIKEEPEVIFEDSSNDDIISSSAIDLFGDIVEIK